MHHSAVGILLQLKKAFGFKVNSVLFHQKTYIALFPDQDAATQEGSSPRGTRLHQLLSSQNTAALCFDFLRCR